MSTLKRHGFFVANAYEGCPHNHRTLEAARRCGKQILGRGARKCQYSIYYGPPETVKRIEFVR